MENTNWIQIRTTCKAEDVEDVCAVMCMINNGLMIEDYSDVERDLDGVYGDLIDEELLSRDRTTVSVSVYIPEIKNPAESEGFIRERLAALSVPATVEIIGVHESDWADSWKQYYKPIKIGEKIVICPAWESYKPAEGELVIRMDPGMAFGTGTHETTSMCVELIEKHYHGGKVLDVGTGSGILAIAAAKLGAHDVLGVLCQ